MFDAVLAILFVLLSWLGGSVPVAAPQPVASPVAEGLYLVERVVDGDTMVVRMGENSERVRLTGIDAPEVGRDGVEAECGAQAATAILGGLVEGKEVRLESDVSNRDEYGRLLRYVYVGEVFVNEQMVATGNARPVTYPPDEKMAETLQVAMEAAQRAGQGMWSDACHAS